MYMHCTWDDVYLLTIDVNERGNSGGQKGRGKGRRTAHLLDDSGGLGVYTHTVTVCM